MKQSRSKVAREIGSPRGGLFPETTRGVYAPDARLPLKETIHTNWPVQYQKFPLGVVQMNYHVQNRGLLVLKINASLNRREKYFNQMDEYFYFYSF